MVVNECSLQELSKPMLWAFLACAYRANFLARIFSCPKESGIVISETCATSIIETMIFQRLFINHVASISMLMLLPAK